MRSRDFVCTATSRQKICLEMACALSWSWLTALEPHEEGRQGQSCDERGQGCHRIGRASHFRLSLCVNNEHGEAECISTIVHSAPLNGQLQTGLRTHSPCVGYRMAAQSRSCRHSLTSFGALMSMRRLTCLCSFFSEVPSKAAKRDRQTFKHDMRSIQAEEVSIITG